MIDPDAWVMVFLHFQLLVSWGRAEETKDKFTPGNLQVEFHQHNL